MQRDPVAREVDGLAARERRLLDRAARDHVRGHVGDRVVQHGGAVGTGLDRERLIEVTAPSRIESDERQVGRIDPRVGADELRGHRRRATRGRSDELLRHLRGEGGGQLELGREGLQSIPQRHVGEGSVWLDPAAVIWRRAYLGAGSASGAQPPLAAEAIGSASATRSRPAAFAA